jgi:site-specific recombinase XerC
VTSRRGRYDEWAAMQRRDESGCIAWPYRSVPPAYLDDADRARIDAGNGDPFEIEVRKRELETGMAGAMVPGGLIAIPVDLAYDGSHTTRRTFPQVRDLRASATGDDVSAGQSVAVPNPYQESIPPSAAVSELPGEAKWVDVIIGGVIVGRMVPAAPMDKPESWRGGTGPVYMSDIIAAMNNPYAGACSYHEERRERNQAARQPHRYARFRFPPAAVIGVTSTARLRLVPPAAGDHGDGGPSTASAVAEHLAHCRLRGLSEETIRQRQQNLDRLAAFLDPVKLLDATPDHLMSWRRSLDGKAAATVAVYVSHISEFYFFAMKHHLTRGDPAEGIPVPKVPRRLPRPIGEEALMHCLVHASPRARIWLVLAGWAGLRAKEVALLRGENVWLAADPPVILVTSDATKGIRERTVPVSSFVAAELRLAGLPATGPCFRKADGGPVPPNLVSRVCNRHLHELGIADTYHALRHRFGTGVYRASHDLRAVQELLGHSSPSTTAGYAAWDRTEAAEAVEALPVPPAG